MKLWVINQYASKPDVAGLTRHFELAKRLIGSGIRTLIIYGSFDLYLKKQPTNDDLPKKPKVQLSEFEGVQFLTIPTPPYRDNRSLGRIINMIAFRRRAYSEMALGRHGKPDMILGSTMTLFGADAARILAKQFDVPFVYEVRDLWPLTPIELGGYSRWHPFLVYLDHLDRKLARSADLVIITAPLMKEYYKERFGIPDEKFLWITNGTDLELFKNLPQADEEAGKDSFDICYAGAHGLANGLDQVFDKLPAVPRKHPEIRLTLVGDGPLKPRLRERAQKEGLPVCFLDAVPKNELPPILNKADALLTYLEPCRLYRYGISLNKLADYHAMGKPILFIGDCAENPVMQSGAGLIAQSIEDFPSVLNKVIQMSPKERQEMGYRGRAYAEEHYDWAALAEKMSITLDKLIAHRSDHEEA